MITVTYLSPRLVWRQLGRPGARCRDCSPVRFPRPPAEPGVRLHRTGLSTCCPLVSRWGCGSGSTGSGSGRRDSGSGSP